MTKLLPETFVLFVGTALSLVSTKVSLAESAADLPMLVAKPTFEITTLADIPIVYGHHRQRDGRSLQENTYIQDGRVFTGGWETVNSPIEAVDSAGRPLNNRKPWCTVEYSHVGWQRMYPKLKSGLKFDIKNVPSNEHIDPDWIKLGSTDKKGRALELLCKTDTNENAKATELAPSSLTTTQFEAIFGRLARVTPHFKEAAPAPGTDATAEAPEELH